MGAARQEPGRPCLPSTNRARRPAQVQRRDQGARLVGHAGDGKRRGNGGRLAYAGVVEDHDLVRAARASTNDGDQLSMVPPRPMISKSGCPLPSSRYPTRRQSVTATRTGTVEDVGGGGRGEGLGCGGPGHPGGSRDGECQQAGRCHQRTRNLDHVKPPSAPPVRTAHRRIPRPGAQVIGTSPASGSGAAGPRRRRWKMGRPAPPLMGESLGCRL